MGESSKSRDELLGRLAQERGHVTPEQLEQARAAQRTAEEMVGVEIGLPQVLLNKQFLTPEQMRELWEAEPSLAELDQEPAEVSMSVETESARPPPRLRRAPSEASAKEGVVEDPAVVDDSTDRVAPDRGPPDASTTVRMEGVVGDLGDQERPGPGDEVLEAATGGAALAEEPAALEEQAEALKAELREKDEALAEFRSINVEIRAAAAGDLRRATAAAADVARYRQEAEEVRVQFSLKNQLIKQLLDEEKTHKEVARERETLSERMDDLMRRAAEAEALKAELELARREAARADELEHQLRALGQKAAEAQALKAELSRARQQLARAVKMARQFRELRTRLTQEAAGKKEAQDALAALKALKAEKAAEAKVPPRPAKRKVWSESAIDELFGRLAIERGYLSREQIDEARTTKKRAVNATGIDIDLVQILVSKHLLTPDQAHDLQGAVSVQTGEARLVAGYEVVAKLGQGGMGAVYKARRLDTGEFVALKILLPSLATKDYIARFRRESEIVQKLHHENIVRSIEFGYDPKKKWYFCALEFVEGENLDDIVERDGVLSEDKAISITYQIARALQHAHFNTLVHRDVKPANVMVTPDGTAKLLDLGLARPADMEVTRLTKSGMFVGSPHFASPEQARSERELDIRSDIYSLGATPYYMITGRPPFEGGSAVDILRQHVYETLTWPADVNPEISDGLCLIVSRMMAKGPADRYQTPKDVLRDLDGLDEGREPEVTEEVMRTSSIQPAVRPQKRRPRPASRSAPRSKDRRERAGPGSEHGRRRGRQGTTSMLPANLPTVPVAIAVALLVLLLLVALLKGFFGG